MDWWAWVIWPVAGSAIFVLFGLGILRVLNRS